MPAYYEISRFDMFAAVAIFTGLTTPLAVILWSVIRRFKKRRVMWLRASTTIALACVLISGVDVSFGGKSPILSIFCLFVIPIYFLIVLLIVAVAAVVLR